MPWYLNRCTTQPESLPAPLLLPGRDDSARGRCAATIRGSQDLSPRQFARRARHRDQAPARDVRARNTERLSRFEREARLLAAMNHPNIATLYGLETHEDVRFIVMELIEGETLAELVARGPLSVDCTRALFIQIADALAAAHAKGIVHRDLKPANVMVSADDRVKSWTSVWPGAWHRGPRGPPHPTGPRRLVRRSSGPSWPLPPPGSNAPSREASRDNSIAPEIPKTLGCPGFDVGRQWSPLP